MADDNSYINERSFVIGSGKSKALIGLHNETGTDWDGKFFNISKKKWIKKFLELTPIDAIVKTFQRFGSVDTPDQLALKHIERLFAKCTPAKVHASQSATCDGNFSGRKALKGKICHQHRTLSSHTYKE